MHSKWRLLLETDGEPAWNMAVDEALLRRLPENPLPILRIYGWSEPAVSIGYFQDTAAVPAGRAFVRRYTGGGLVDHAADLTYTVILPRTHPWMQLPLQACYRRLHEAVTEALATLGSQVQLAPCEHSAPAHAACFQRAVPHDVVSSGSGQKIAGAAQRRTREGLLHQGSILPDGAPDLIEWRTNLRRALPEVFAKRFDLSWQQEPLAPTERERALELVRTRYGTSAWNAQPPHAVRLQTA
jgi:lipoate-protein ligase A